MEPISDEALIAAIAQKDQLAFRELYGRYAAKLYNTALAYLQNEQDAEEVTQEVCLIIFRKAATFRGDSKASTWIYRITVNTALAVLKRRRIRISRAQDIPDLPLADFVHPGVLIERQEQSTYLYRVIHALPERQKTAFVLGLVENLPRQEVADIMGLSLKAVESLLQRAKQNLRQKLKEWYYERRIP
ncbi:MAG: RNA polymerase sigma factor [Bacteroidota bacterium]